MAEADPESRNRDGCWNWRGLIARRRSRARLVPDVKERSRPGHDIGPDERDLIAAEAARPVTAMSLRALQIPGSSVARQLALDRCSGRTTCGPATPVKCRADTVVSHPCVSCLRADLPEQRQHSGSTASGFTVRLMDPWLGGCRGGVLETGDLSCGCPRSRSEGDAGVGVATALAAAADIIGYRR